VTPRSEMFVQVISHVDFPRYQLATYIISTSPISHVAKMFIFVQFFSGIEIFSNFFFKKNLIISHVV
jgi:hypothetical protein